MKISTFETISESIKEILNIALLLEDYYINGYPEEVDPEIALRQLVKSITKSAGDAIIDIEKAIAENIQRER